MLRRYNDERLGKLHIPQVYWLFYQIWGEVTEPRTLSTYQYRLMNTLSILFELKDVLSKTWKRIYPTKNHLGECLDEAREIISQDIVLETKFPDLQRILTAALSENPDGQNDYLVMMAQIDFFLRSVQARYLDSLLEALHDRIIEGTETRAAQAQLLWLTKQIVSVCVYKGGEISVLKTAHRILQKPMDSSEDRWGAFVRALQAGGSYTFFVCIPVFPDCMLRKSHQVDGQADARKARFDKTIESDETIEIKKGSEILRYIHKTEDNAIRNDTQYFVITIQAADMYTASRNAMGRYAALMNILSFYNVIYPWSLEHRKLVVVNGAETGEATIDSIAIDRLYRSFEYREGAARLFEHTFSYLKRAEQQPQTEIQQRIEAAFNYANIGKGTSVQSERFINIWIALEVLCRTQMSGSIIGSILDVIPAALSLRYIYRLYRNFLEDCFRCDISLEFRGICILRTDEKECSVCRLLEIFSNLESYEELETRCSVNGLLRCRCIELHKMLENRTPLIEKIKKHHQNVSWQLSRLYRMRNDIAHSARSDGEYLVKYNEHLMEYLYSFVAEIIYYLSNPDHHVQTMNDVQITFQNRYYMFGILADAYEKKRKKGKDTTYEDRMMENLCKTGVVSIPTELLENTGSCSSLGIIHGKRI